MNVYTKLMICLYCMCKHAQLLYSVFLQRKVHELRRIELSLPRGGHVTGTVQQLCQQLLDKEEECRQKDEVIRHKQTVIEGKNEALQHLDQIIRENATSLSEKDETLRQQADTIRAQQIEILRLTHQPVMAETVS